VSDRIDDAARALAAGEAERMTRGGVLRLAAGTGLALGAASAFGPLLTTARADDYCLEHCMHDASSALARDNNFTAAALLKSYGTSAVPIFRVPYLAVVAASVVDDYANYYNRRQRCYAPNCGNGQKYPPPPPPPPPPDDYCLTCTSVGGYCLPCAAVAEGKLCCALPPKPDDPNPCCPKS